MSCNAAARTVITCADGREPSGIEVFSITAKSGKGVQAMSMPGNGACPRGQRRTRSGPGLNRPIDIDRTPLRLETRRVNGNLGLQSI
jgi:hypothetical protein